jgi:AcrR family transcriptional regulator
MKTGTRTRMIAGAAEMIARRGVSATSVREVVRHTETPRGSIAHHFPGGKQQLIEEAVSFAGKAIAVPLDRMLQDKGAVEGVALFIAFWRKHLETTNFGSGCPVLAVCLEEAFEKQGVTPGDQGAAEQVRLLDIANSVFLDWRSIIAQALQREGVSTGRAKRLATLSVAAVEGTVAMCRASRNAQSLDEVSRELAVVISEAVESAKAPATRHD